MKSRLEEKIEELEKYLEEFETIEIPEIEEYKKNIKIKAICERYFEKIVGAIISVSILLIKEKSLISPETEEQAFLILAKNKIISEELSEKLKEAKNMRNIIIHNYQKVDNEIVYDSITAEILKDAKDFISSIKEKRLR